MALLEHVWMIGIVCEHIGQFVKLMYFVYIAKIDNSFHGKQDCKYEENLVI